MHRASHPLLEATLKRLEGAYANATVRAYRADFENFVGYCFENGHRALPSEGIAVAGFVEELSTSGVKSASIRRAISAISTIHRVNGFMDPTHHIDPLLAMRRMHRTLGRAAKQANPISNDHLRMLMGVCDDSLRGLRNKAMIKVGFDTLCRRGELVSLDVEDIRPRKILLRRSKTDPYGLGRWLAVSSEGDRLLRMWLTAAGITRGAIFRGIDAKGELTERLDPGQPNRILKSLAQKAGLDYRIISGHSLRVGAAQDLLLKGASLPTIMQRGRWSKTDTMMRYLENAPASDLMNDEGEVDSEFGPPPTSSNRYPR